MLINSDWRRVTLPRSWRLYSVSRSSCVCTLVTCRLALFWSAFASLRGIFDNEHGSLAVAHFGLRSGLAPLLRSRRSDVTRLAPCCCTTILGHSYRAYADLFTRAILLTVSVAPWRGIAPRLCPTLIDATSSDADAGVIRSRTLLPRLHGVSLRSCLTKP